MELRQLHYFLVVAEELNFGRAAQRLHIVQPAVSQQIRRLERELGVELFDRTTRRVTLTEAGREFVPRARAVVDAEERAREAVRNGLSGPAARLRVGSATGLGRRLHAALAAFYAVRPDVEVELVKLPHDERLRRVREHTLDAAVVRGQHAEAGLRMEPIGHDDLVVVLPASHELAGPGAVSLSMLEKVPLRLVDRAVNPTLVDTLHDACRVAGFEPVRAASRPTNSDADLLASIAVGRPSWTIYYAARAQQLNAAAIGIAFVPIAPPGLSVATALAVRAGDRSEPLLQFVEVCRQESGAANR